VTGQSSANSTRLQIWTCTNASNQKWTLPGGTAPTTPPTTSPTTAPPTTAPPTTPPGAGTALDNPAKKDVAMQIVSAAENSSLNWRGQFGYIEDIRDGRGYTAGIIGFCSGTSDMLALVEAYTRTKPGNVLAKYLPALRNVNGSDSHAGLDPNYTKDWETAAADPVFRDAQESERDRVYFNPSVRDGKSDGVRALGQFAYYDAAVMHGYSGFRSIRSKALRSAKPPAQGGDETEWLRVFMNERKIEMRTEEAHSDTTRVDTAQLEFLNAGNLDLNTPLSFKVYGQSFRIG
jgi:chitosanase